MAKVLVLDDDADARHVMCAMLRNVGHEPHGSADPAQAIHEALTLKPDVLVADWILKPDRTVSAPPGRVTAAQRRAGLSSA